MMWESASYRDAPKRQLSAGEEALQQFLCEGERLVWTGTRRPRSDLRTLLTILIMMGALLSVVSTPLACFNFLFIGIHGFRPSAIVMLAPFVSVLGTTAFYMLRRNREKRRAMLYGVSNHRVITVSEGELCWVRSVLPLALLPADDESLRRLKLPMPKDAADSNLARGGLRALCASTKPSGLIAVHTSMSPTNRIFHATIKELLGPGEDLLWSTAPKGGFVTSACPEAEGAAVTSKRVISVEGGHIRQVELADIGVIALEMTKGSVGTIFVGAGADLKLQNAIVLEDITGAARVHRRLLGLLFG